MNDNHLNEHIGFTFGTFEWWIWSKDFNYNVEMKRVMVLYSQHIA